MSASGFLLKLNEIYSSREYKSQRSHHPNQTPTTKTSKSNLSQRHTHRRTRTNTRTNSHSTNSFPKSNKSQVATILHSITNSPSSIKSNNSSHCPQPSPYSPTRTCSTTTTETIILFSKTYNKTWQRQQRAAQTI